MLSNHFPFTYGHSYGWIDPRRADGDGASVRHYFNLRHRGINAWPILVLACAGLLATALIIQ